MITVVTHSGNFHADDVCAVAVLELLLGPGSFTVVRSRDEGAIAAADWVVDVGGVYDPARQRFDHHQLGAPVRDNGVPYAAFGLVWKHFGVEVAGGQDVAEAIDRRLVQPVDLGDNGVAHYTLIDPALRPFELFSVIDSFRPLGKDAAALDAGFAEAVTFARELLVRVIARTRHALDEENRARELYEAAPGPIVVSPTYISEYAFVGIPEVRVVVRPDSTPGQWVAVAVSEGDGVFGKRAAFPETWAGLRDAELVAASGIADARFCHRGRFNFVSGSEAAARVAAERAIAA